MNLSLTLNKFNAIVFPSRKECFAAMHKFDKPLINSYVYLPLPYMEGFVVQVCKEIKNGAYSNLLGYLTNWIDYENENEV